MIWINHPWNRSIFKIIILSKKICFFSAFLCFQAKPVHRVYIVDLTEKNGHASIELRWLVNQSKAKNNSLIHFSSAILVKKKIIDTIYKHQNNSWFQEFEIFLLKKNFQDFEYHLFKANSGMFLHLQPVLFLFFSIFEQFNERRVTVQVVRLLCAFIVRDFWSLFVE